MMKKPPAPSVKTRGSYGMNTCAGCGASCDMRGPGNGSCWGRVLFAPDHDMKPRHFCAAHDDPERYRPQPAGEA